MPANGLRPSDEMQLSAERVNRTRSRRLIADSTVSMPPNLLEAFHPDFRLQAKKRLAIGSNAGDFVPAELANVLNGGGIVEPRRLPRVPAHDTDVLIIGSGGAGLAAALAAHDRGASVAIATKLRLGDSNTAMATGFACALDTDDSPERHFRDTVETGRNAASPELVRAMVEDGPQIVRWLMSMGADFIRDASGRKLQLAGHGCGHSIARTVCARGGLTGLEIVRVLRSELRSRGIAVFESSPAIELALDGNGGCCGAALLRTDDSRLALVRAKAVVLATGGIGQLRLGGFPTSNHHGATGDGLVLAYRLGVGLRDAQSIQYHPTGSAWPPASEGWLLTEGMRLYGAQLLNVQGERFVDERDVRDVVTAAIIREITEGRGIRTSADVVGVWLDTPLLHALEPDFKSSPIVAKYRRLGVDPCQQPLLVAPTQHYQNGGLEIDDKGGTMIGGLFAAGEIAGGIHGLNRLGGNAVLDALVFGRRAGAAAAQRVSETALCRQVTYASIYDHNQSVVTTDRVVAPRLFPYSPDATAARFQLGAADAR